MDGAHVSEELADEFAVGALEPEIRDLISLHAAACPPCAKRIRNSQDIASMLALGAPVRRARPRLRRRVFALAGIGRGGWALSVVRKVPSAAGVAASVAAIVALTGMFMLRADVSDLEQENHHLQAQVDDALSQEVEIAALQRRLSDAERSAFALEAAAQGDRELLLALLSPETEVAGVFSVDEQSEAFGRLVWNESQQKLYFVAANLDPRPLGETYQIWIDRDGRYLSIGTFNTDDTGFARYEVRLSGGIDAYQSAIVTVERAGGALQRSGPSVFVTDLSSLRE